MSRSYWTYDKDEAVRMFEYLLQNPKFERLMVYWLNTWPLAPEWIGKQIEDLCEQIEIELKDQQEELKKEKNSQEYREER
jgi:hypothetical protein